MNICIYGCGAVGSNLAVRLSEAGHRVSVVARGAHLEAIRASGLTLLAGDREIRATVAASDRPETLGKQELVIATLKSHDLPAAAEDVAPLMGSDTPVLFAQNGIPWWYGDKLGGRPAAPDLGMLDPAGSIRRTIGVERSLGAVIYSSNEIVAPGIVRNSSPTRNRLLVGEIDDRETPRAAEIRAILAAADIASPPVADLRRIIWGKVIANLRVSVPGLILELTSHEVFQHPALREMIEVLGAEAVAVAAAHGIEVELERGGPAPGHKSSMLQDYEAKRRQEIAALIDAPLAFADAAGVETPTLRTIAALARAKAGWEGRAQPH